MAAVVTELRQLYGELQERLPQAHATRRVGLDISVEVNVEEVALRLRAVLFAATLPPVLMSAISLQASQAAIVLEDIVGHQAGADAGFMLAVLSATGIAAPDVSLNDTRAVQLLHTSARGGSEEAELALAHRYYFGDGVPKSCPEGIR